jgi:hypothetical protein
MADDLDFDPAQTSGPGDAETTEPEAPSVSGAKGSVVTLVVAGPFFQTAIQFPDGDGGVVRFDNQKGTEVPATEAETYIERAKAAGVTLTEKKKG